MPFPQSFDSLVPSTILHKKAKGHCSPVCSLQPLHPAAESATSSSPHSLIFFLLYKKTRKKAICCKEITSTITNAGLFFCMLCHPFPEIVSLLQTIATILRTTVCRATFPKNLLFFRWEKCLTNHFFFVMMVMYMHDFIEHFNR